MTRHIAKLIFPFLLLILSFMGFSQPNLPPQTADSLWQVWEDENQPDSNRFKAMFTYTWKGYVFTKPDTAIYYINQFFELAEEKENYKFMGTAMNSKGAAYWVKGNLDSAIYFFKKTQDYWKEIDNKEGMSASFNNIAIIKNSQGNAIEAIDYYTKSLKLREELGKPNLITQSLNNIGSVYLTVGENDKALEYFEKCYKIAKENDDKSVMSSSTNNMGYIFNLKKDYEKSLQYYEQSLALKKEIADQKGSGITLVNIADVIHLQGHLDSSLVIYNKALNIGKEIGNKYLIAATNSSIGEVYLEKGQYSKAIEYCLKGLQLTEELGDIEIRGDITKTLWKTYKKINQPKKALEAYEMYITARDSLKSEENKSEVLRQGFKYEYEKQAALDSLEYAKEQKLAKAESDKKDAELQAKKNQQYALFGGLSLVLIFAIFMYNRFRITRKQKDIIAEQKVEVEEQRDYAKREHEEAEKQKHIVEEKNNEIMDSIQYAKRLQDAILPPIKLVKEYFDESFILFQPKDIVSGDFYWMETKDNLIMFAAADCTGHGVPGAMVSVVCANALNKTVNELGKTDPAEILNATRELVIDTFSKSGNDVKDGMDISLCVLNEGIETLHWAGANNPLWIVRRDQNEIEAIKPDKQPIGMYGELLPFTTHTIKINGGDSIYMFSDGYADQFGGERGKKMKSGKFKQLLLEHRHENMEQQKQALEKAFEDWKGDLEQIDDVCVIGVRLTEKEANPFTRREMEIIQLLKDGNSSKMIADELNISKTTVDTHRRKILKKVNAGNVTELLKVCQELKIL